MFKLNSVRLLGTLAKDADVKFIESQDPPLQRLTLLVAGNVDIMGDDGKSRSPAFYQRVTLFGKAFDHLTNSLVAGQAVMVDGMLNYREWGEEGNKQSMVDVKGYQLELLSGAVDTKTDKSGGQRLQNAINEVRITGNLTRDAIIKDTGNGSVVNLRVAYDESYKVENRWMTRGHYFDAEGWNQLAEKAEGLKKGDMVMLFGRVTTETFEAAGGEKRSRTFIELTRLEKLKRVGKNNQFFEEDLPF
jgi:single stranded DNA-binding protein